MTGDRSRQHLTLPDGRRFAYGLHDVLVPAAHGAWLAEHVPHAVPDVREDECHMGDADRIAERMRWFVPGSED